MANDITTLTPEISTQIAMNFRENAIMPRLINTDYNAEVSQRRGDTININVMRDMSTRTVVPGMTTPTSGLNDVASDNYPLILDQWEESPFVLTDKEFFEIVETGQSKAIEKAVQALANKIDLSILETLYQNTYNYTGTAGTTPFGAGSLLPAQEASRVLTTGLAPKDGMRQMVLDEFAYANALGIPSLQKVNESGSNETLRSGRISQVLGFNWAEDQNVPTHTTTMSGTYAVDAVGAVGDTTVVLDDGAGSAPTTPGVGDLFTIAGSTQVYTITAVAAATPTANEVTVTVRPSLDQVTADGDAVTIAVTGSYAVNMAFHSEAITMASRPLADVAANSLIELIPDPVTGMVLRYEIKREHKQTTFSVDALWGLVVPYADKSIRILGQ